VKRRPAPHLCLASILVAILAGCSDRETSLATGPFAVGYHEYEFVDTSRPTPANGDVPAKSTRTLLTRVYYPADGGASDTEVLDATKLAGAGPFPLIVFSHGLGAVAEVYRGLLHAWAQAGYVVAAPNFPLSNARAEGGPVAADYVNQPGDVSFVIDRMLDLGASGGDFAGLIAAEHIGTAGQSLGGFTTLGVAFNTCCLDRRLRAAIPMSAAAPDFPGTYFTGIDTPLLGVHGDADDTVPYAKGLEYYALANRPKAFVTVIGGDHIVPFVAGENNPETAPVRESTLAFFDLYLKRRADARARLDAVGDLPNARIDDQLD
jgi:predicted dienelactone hydrolase